MTLALKIIYRPFYLIIIVFIVSCNYNKEGWTFDFLELQNAQKDYFSEIKISVDGARNFVEMTLDSGAKYKRCISENQSFFSSNENCAYLMEKTDNSLDYDFQIFHSSGIINLTNVSTEECNNYLTNQSYDINDLVARMKANRDETENGFIQGVSVLTKVCRDGEIEVIGYYIY